MLLGKESRQRSTRQTRSCFDPNLHMKTSISYNSPFLTGIKQNREVKDYRLIRGLQAHLVRTPKSTEVVEENIVLSICNSQNLHTQWYIKVSYLKSNFNFLYPQHSLVTSQNIPPQHPSSRWDWMNLPQSLAL